MRGNRRALAGLCIGLASLLSSCSLPSKTNPPKQVDLATTITKPARNVYQVVITGSIEERFRADTEIANASAELAGIPVANRIILEKEKGPLYASEGTTGCPELLPRYVRDGCASPAEIKETLRNIVSKATIV